MNPQPWMTSYPTVAAVLEAGLPTLLSWRDHLAPAQTDVERTVQRRIQQRIQVVGLREVRAASPEIADKFEQLNAEFERITGRKAPEL